MNEPRRLIVLNLDRGAVIASPGLVAERYDQHDPEAGIFHTVWTVEAADVECTLSVRRRTRQGARVVPFPSEKRNVARSTAH